MSHKTHKIHLIQYTCWKTPEVMHNLLEDAKETTNMVIFQEPSNDTDPNDPIMKIISSHRSFHQITPKNQKDHNSMVTTFITNSNPYLKYQIGTDIVDNRDIQCIEISTGSIRCLYLFNVYNQKVEGAENNSQPAK